MNKKKSLLLSEVFPPQKGGIQTWAYQLAKNYDGQMEIVAPKVKGSFKFDRGQNFKIHRVGHRPFDSIFDRLVGKIAHITSPGSRAEVISACQWLPAALRLKSKLQAVHCIHIRSAYLAYLLKKWFGLPYFVYTHGLELASVLESKSKRKFYSFLLKNANKVFANSGYTKNLVAKFGVSKENIKVVPLGVNYRRFKPDFSTKNLEKKLGLKDEKVVFSVSRLVKRKGFDVSIKAFARVADKLDKVKYIIGGSGPEEESLKKLAKSLGINNRVVFIGRIKDKDLPAYYSLADLFIMPSRKIGPDIEGFGIVFLEAGACQTPVIGGNSGGVPSAIEDGKTGYLVEPKNVKEIARKMERVLQNERLAESMGKKARERVKEKYNWQNSVKTVKEIEEKTISSYV